LKKLQEMPTVADPACRLLTTPDDVSVHAISIYKAVPSSASGADNSSTSGRVHISVERPGDVLLVLSSYESSSWQVRLGTQTRIAGVLMTGYHASVVEGLNSDVSVRSVF
jgi:hypothetical protein